MIKAAGISNGGWCRLDDDEWPGPIYVRVTEVDGHLRISEVYIDGRGAALENRHVRQLNLAQIESWLLGRDGETEIRSMLRHPGPDLSRLASSYADTWGDIAYAGRHCEECNAPLRRGAPLPSGKEKALTDWVALSWFAQFPRSGIPQVPMGPDPEPVERPAVMPLVDPAGARLTDEFLCHVAASYNQAVSEGKPPAKELAAQAGVSPRQVHKWVYIARKRGCMDPATSRGRVV